MRRKIDLKIICLIYLIINISYILLAFCSAFFPLLYYFALSLIYYHVFHFTYIHILFGIVLVIIYAVRFKRKPNHNIVFLIFVIIDVLINFLWEFIARFLISIR